LFSTASWRAIFLQLVTSKRAIPMRNSFFIIQFINFLN
jgi:hypothetical protein